MALFKKKRTLDEILEDVKNLTPDEAKELHEKMSDLYKAEDEREIDKIEEDKAEIRRRLFSFFEFFMKFRYFFT